MLFVAGTPRRYLLCGAGRASPFWARCSWWTCFLCPQNWQLKFEDYQRRRLMVYFGIRNTPRLRGVRRLSERLRKQQDG